MQRIPLRDRKGNVRAWTLVDDADYDDVAQHVWALGDRGYARRMDHGPHHKRRAVFLHRYLLGLGYGDRRQTDHINLDKLDNQRANLRVVTRAQNAQNRRSMRDTTSEFRGVCWSKADRKWRAYANVQRDGQSVRLHFGYYDDEREAARVASEARAKLMPFSADARELREAA